MLSISTPKPTALVGSFSQEYDPAKPNDYDEFCRRRMRLKAEEEMEKRRQVGFGGQWMIYAMHTGEYRRILEVFGDTS